MHYNMKNTSEDAEKKIASIIRKELKNENYDDSCWLKAFSKADGDEQKAKVLYIELRTSDLKKEKQKEKLLEDLKTHSQMRCGRSFCNNAYKILSIPKTSIGIQKCEGCGNMLEEKVSEKNALDAIDNLKSKPINYSTKPTTKSISLDGVYFLNASKDLKIMFWGYFIGVNFLITLLMFAFGQNDGAQSLLGVLRIVWMIVGTIGVFKSADIYKKKKIKERLEYPLATTAKVACIILTVSSIGQSIT